MAHGQTSITAIGGGDLAQEYGSERYLPAGEPDYQHPEWRADLPRILSAFLLSRLLVLLVAGSLTAIPFNHDPDTWSDRPILSALTGLDSVYYLGIAAEGYHLEPIKQAFHDWAFFPLYPLVVRAASVLTFGDVAIAGILVANVAFLAAMLVLHVLTSRHLGRETSLVAVGFVALAPGAVAFSMAYTDSLFLLLSAGTFLAAERRRWWLTGVLYALATLTRLPGVLLGIPLAVLMLQSAAWRPTRALAWLASGPLALGAFSLWLGDFTGDPLAFVRAQGAWAIPSMLGDGTTAPRMDLLPLLLVATLLFYTFLLVYFRPDRIPVAYLVMAVVGIATVIGSLRLQSVGRYLAVVWPFAWILANRRAAWFRELWPYATAGLFTLHAFLHFTQALAP